jgi:REP element-mobilizing transposase RayT
MATPHRPQFENALYHVTTRGVDRQRIVRDDIDCEHWVASLSDAVRATGTVVHAWCLMTNHNHLLIQTPLGNIAAAMQRLNSSYALMHNKRHGRVGHLFQGRYHSLLIERDEHLLECARYVVLNPVRAGVCDSPERWRWSSYRATAGLAPRPGFLTTSWLLEQFDADAKAARRRYVDFVSEGSATSTVAGLLLRC